MFFGGSAHLAVAVLPTLALWSWDLSSYLHAGAETGVVYLERPSAKSRAQTLQKASRRTLGEACSFLWRPLAARTKKQR